MAYNFYKNLDITDIKLELNTIGSKESRKEYTIGLKKYLEKFKKDVEKNLSMFNASARTIYDNFKKTI